VTGDWSPAPGELLWLDFSPTVGTEQAGRRPALVISDADYNAASCRAVIMPITSRVRGWPFEVTLPGVGPVKGAVLADQVRSVDWRARFAKTAGFVHPGVLEEARTKLASLTGG
jgi:mRNA interferase MazF